MMETDAPRSKKPTPSGVGEFTETGKYIDAIEKEASEKVTK